MRIHLGHHFYGAGNLGDDFMLAGFLASLRRIAPDTALSCSVPFPLKPLLRRFPEIEWMPYDEAARLEAIRSCDAWLGLGGSPFQSAQSRWFIDHLASEAAFCRIAGKPMFYLGIGVQTAEELAVPEVRALCTQAKAIWTRDAASAARLTTLSPDASVHAAADLAHVYFREHRPPGASSGRVTVVANFDYSTWDAAPAFLRAIDALGPRERVWVAQESRSLPGAEKATFAALPIEEQRKWRLVAPDETGVGPAHPASTITSPTLQDVLACWPSGEWLLTARYHAAIAGAWAGSKVVVIGTNEKLRAIAGELGAPLVDPGADEASVTRALQMANPAVPPANAAHVAFEACREFAQLAGSA